MIFYISSQGHAASGWIAKSFSVDPRVICWHAIRTIPPAIQDRPYRKMHIPSGWDREAAGIFVEDLNFCAETSGGNVFGAIHTIWGITAKKAIEDRGGKFAGTIRHPIMQMNSMISGFTARVLSQHALRCDTHIDHQEVISRLEDHLEEGFELGRIKFKNASFNQKLRKLYNRANIVRDELYVKYKKPYSNLDDINLIEEFFKKDKSMLAYIMARLFIHSASRTMDEHDTFNRNLNEDCLIVSEEITKSESYFRSKFDLLTGLENYSGSWADITKSSHVNYHDKRDKQTKTPQVIWESWTPPMQEFFLNKLNGKPELLSKYREYSYWLPL